MKHRRKIHEIDSTNDIKYRGPLNYQHFRIAAWIFLALAQVGILLQVGSQIAPEKVGGHEKLQFIISLLGDTATPLLLIANFAMILTAKENFKKLLIKFGALSIGTIGIFMVIYERYAIGILSVGGSRESARELIDSVLQSKVFLSFNLFLDLFLCTLVMFFLEYTPKKLFKGKALIVFRLLAILPVAYEAVSVVIKVLSSFNKITIPVYVFPFLTTKPPFGFLIFVALALFIKRRERKFIKQGKTREEYKEFLGTNANSWHFSVHAAIIMVVVAVLDILAAVVFTTIAAFPSYGTEAFDYELIYALMLAQKCGLGGTAPLIIVAPFMLLFSYNRKPKHDKLDLLIPIAGIALIIVVYVEGIYQAIMQLT
ncbi:MAG: hypothetical protein IJS45_00110 [Clostridia bacterium]|nr:hypothetical protein [Clostridia bacterium]